MAKASRSTQSSPNRHPWVGALLKGLIVFFSYLPLSANRVLGRFIGLVLWWIPNENKRITQINIDAAYPQRSDEERQRLAKASLMHLGLVTTELGPAWCWPEGKLLNLVKEVKGEALLDEALKSQRGILMLAPHIGAWEIVGAYVSARYPSTYLYRPPNILSVEEFMIRARSRFGAKLVPTNMRGVRDLVKGLKAREVSAILPDQDPGESGGVYAPFFGRPARTMTLASKLIQKSDCVFLFTVMERLPGTQGYRLHFLPAETAVASENPETAAAALNRGVEACVAVAPEQYLWSYKRYRKPPPGVENLYKKPS